VAIRAELNPGRITAIVAVAVLGAAAASAGAPAASASATAAPPWRITKLIPTPNTFLYDVAALSGGTAWAVGQKPGPLPLAYHLTGGHWHTVALPGPTGSFAGDVSATSPANVWVTLPNFDELARRSGNTWAVKSFGSPTHTGLAGVVTTGPDNTWAFTFNMRHDQSRAQHYNGISWRASTLPDDAIVGGAGFAPSYSGAVSATSSSNIWAYAAPQRGPYVHTVVTLHYNGKRWQTKLLPVLPPTLNYYLDDIWTTAPANAWVTVTTISSSHPGAPGPLVLLHWNGHRWSKLGGHLPAADLTGAITSDGHGGLWLGAERLSQVPIILHYSHKGTWTTYRLPAAHGIRRGAVSVSALARIPGKMSVLGTSNILYQGRGNVTHGAAFLRYRP
jgi:hypothetical protein